MTFAGLILADPADKLHVGRLWEHYVLNELTAHLQTASLRYWRDKQGHEVDFIWAPRGRTPLAIECKWSARDLDLDNLAVFARAYPRHELLVVTTDALPPFKRQCEGRPVRFLTLDRLVERLAEEEGRK